MIEIREGPALYELSPDGDPAEFLERQSPHARDLRKGRQSLPGKHYFITKGIANRGAKSLGIQKAAETVIKSFVWARKERWLKITAFVVMPDHYHLLMKLGNVLRLETLFERMGRFTSRRINIALNRKGRFWKKSFFDRQVRNHEDIQDYVDYIHMNPVRAELVDEPENWPFSTANCHFRGEMEWE